MVAMQESAYIQYALQRRVRYPVLTRRSSVDVRMNGATRHGLLSIYIFKNDRRGDLVTDYQ